MFLSFLLKSLSPKAIGIFLVAGAIFLSAWHIRGIIAENTLKSRLNSLAIEYTAKCADKQKKLEDANDDLQSKLSVIGKRLASSKLQPAMCAIIKSGVAVNPAGGGEHAGQNGLSTGWLNEYAAECETYRIEVILLDDFGRKNCK